MEPRCLIAALVTKWIEGCCLACLPGSVVVIPPFTIENWVGFFRRVSVAARFLSFDFSSGGRAAGLFIRMLMICRVDCTDVNGGFLP